MTWRVMTVLTLAALTAADRIHDSMERWRDDEDGLTTTEIAVVTFLLVGAAIVVMGVIYAAAKSNADNIPVPEAPAP